MEQTAAAVFGGLQSEHHFLLIAPSVRWIVHFCDLVLSLCITSVGLWTTWSQVKIHTVNTYLVEVAYDACRGLNLHWITAELLSNEFRCVHECGSWFHTWPWHKTTVVGAAKLTLFPR